MPMMIVCDKLAYVPGQIVTGQVVIISRSPQKVKGLTMRFIGRSSKLLGEIEGTKRYKKEVYFDEKIDIFGHDGSSTQLRVGETLYPFTFPLPPGLPSSFEWPEGNVLYFVEAKLTRASWKDKRVSSRIQVEGVFDLNMDPMAVNPIEVKKQKYVKHLLSKSGHYGFTFKCSRSGFVLGHSLPFSVEIRNLSKVNSRKLRISLLQEVKVGDVKSVATLVEQMKGPAVVAGEILTWEARLKVPGGIPPTNLGNVLNYPMVVPVLYFLHVQLSLKNCREEPICIKIPVTVGTISLQRQRALSVPSLEDSVSPAYPFANNGHRIDCPMSQLILPSAAISTSQFSPHLVSTTSLAHAPVSRGGSSLYPHHTIARSNRAPPVQILGPVRQYEYYFEYDDQSTGTTRSVTTRGDSLYPRRRNNPVISRFGRHYIPYSAHSYPITESPPPSYEEIFTRERTSVASGSALLHSVNENSHYEQRVISAPTPSQEVIHHRASSQESSSNEEEEDSSSLVLPLTANDDNHGNSSGSVTPSSCDTESDASSVASVNDDFLSGSDESSEELKCHDDVTNVTNFQQELRNDEPCPCDKVSVHKHNGNNIQGTCRVNNDAYHRSGRNTSANVICDSEDDI